MPFSPTPPPPPPYDPDSFEAEAALSDPPKRQKTISASLPALSRSSSSHSPPFGLPPLVL
eukprot:CAMPEP_0184661386 /NCGR_PEP_ID=MMETSP0308-20130426/38190_1 /TAXON_ID=38269 /ORGANISM="Gloeochaete witrockiana, Strain SAG 46.84" /LENGTH=59 /DNA_ID=CAMNT_0027102659 /DNA_START=188 /DNA_END=364 /DNA_ORIENTATION=-